MHKLLQRQLRRYFGTVEAVPEALRGFLPLVEAAYEQSDADRLMNERAFQITSEEMLELTRRLRLDLEDRKSASEVLARSQREFRQLIESMTEGVVIRERDKVVFANQAAARSLGLATPELAFGRSVLEFIMPSDVAMVRDRIAHGPSDESYEIQMRRADGTAVTQELSPSDAILFDGREAVLMVLRDVTARRRIERQLLLTDRMASVGTLASGVAHEINNPLACVIGNLAFVMEEVERAEPAFQTGEYDSLRDALNDTREAAERIRQIVKTFQLFARPEVEAQGLMDVRKAIDIAVRMAANEIYHRAQLSLDFKEAPLVTGNEGQLVQVLLNILVNAAHAIPVGDAEHHRIRVSCHETPEHKTMIEIEDDGAGIAPDVRARIFDPFFTTRRVGEGRGLGLSVCYGIVSSMNGEIEVDSEVGRGTTFRITLPAAAPVAVAPVIAPVIVAPGRRGHVLVIDDDPLVAASIRRTLRNEHDVSIATNGREGLAALRANPEKYDVVLCDLMMPDLTGMDLYDEVTRTLPSVRDRILFVTGGAFTESARVFVDGLAEPPIMKPFDPEELRTQLRKRLGPADDAAAQGRDTLAACPTGIPDPASSG